MSDNDNIQLTDQEVSTILDARDRHERHIQRQAETKEKRIRFLQAIVDHPEAKYLKDLEIIAGVPRGYGSSGGLVELFYRAYRARIEVYREKREAIEANGELTDDQWREWNRKYPDIRVVRRDVAVQELADLRH